MNSWSIKVMSISVLWGFIGQSVTNAEVKPPGYDHGNGGDYIRELFQDAKKSVARKVSQLRPCSFQGLDAEASSWILKNQAPYASDILNSPHYWTVDPLPTCGYTDQGLGQGIFFSYPTCLNSSNSEEKAKFVLAHESVHHFGITDENFADRVARTVMASVEKISCPAETSPFDPNFCDGPSITKDEVLRFFTPGESVSKYVGPSHFRGRYRRCNGTTGCGEFTGSKVVYVEFNVDQYGRDLASDEYDLSDFEAKDDFRFKVSRDSISIDFPYPLRVSDIVQSNCSGTVWDKLSCSLYQKSSAYGGKQKDEYIGKVTNRCFKLVASYNTTPSIEDGSYYNVEKVWYAEY